MLEPVQSELKSCVIVEVAVLGSPVPNNPYGLCGREATLNLNLNDSPHSAYCSFSFTFRQEPISDFPGKHGGVVSLELLDLGHDARGRHFRFAAADAVASH